MFDNIYSFHLQKSVNSHNGWYQEYTPSLFLKPYVKRYYFTEGYPQFLNRKVYSIGKENIEIAINYENSETYAYNFRNNNYDFNKGYIAGIQRKLALAPSKTMKEIKLLIVELTHIGFYRLFGMYPMDVFNTNIDLVEACGKTGITLISDVVNASNNELRIKIIEQFFKKCLQKKFKMTTHEERYFRFLDYCRIGSVSENCNRLSLQRKTVERMFRKRIGISPKEYLEIIRFNKACGLLSRYPNVNLAEIACYCGYFDQAYFTNEFRAITHTSPLKHLQKVNGFIYMGRGYVV
jgi:AraC-like DNA-binding protein